MRIQFDFNKLAAKTLCILTVALALGSAAPASAETWPYRLEIPEGRRAGFELSFDVEHKGVLAIEAEWTGLPVLTFKIEPPNGLGIVRRSGPSPQRIEVLVDERGLSSSGQWKLSIQSLANGKGGDGMLWLMLPDDAPPPPPPASDPPLIAAADAPETAAAEPWLMARRAPRGASEQQIRMFDSVEQLRQELVSPENTLGLDNCRWQGDMLRYVSYWRDRMHETGEIPPVATRRYLKRVVEAYRDVEKLRNGDDPILAGPMPEQRSRQRAWLRVRGKRIEKIERALDMLSDDVRDGHAPELREQDWPVRLLACLAACERHFDQRLLIGEEKADNLELTLAQWDAIAAAARTLETMVYLVDEGQPARDAVAGR
ncbi:hypothetical protein ABI59_08290 [Acidobacteria bacterium Mor1]|nr:hypothetical protein ABI59_08290 [Acidobacteria bacterium Mor1]